MHETVTDCCAPVLRPWSRVLNFDCVDMADTAMPRGTGVWTSEPPLYGRNPNTLPLRIASDLSSFSRSPFLS